MKNKIIVNIILQIILICLISLQTNVLANDAKDVKTNILVSSVTGLDDFNPDNNKPASTDTSSSSILGQIGNSIAGVIQVIGSAVAIGVLMVIGIKYMLGSVEEKAEYKKTMKPYLIGALIVFGITNLLGILIKIVGDVFK